MSVLRTVRSLVLLALAATFADSLLAAPTLRVKGSDTIGGALGPDLAEAYFEENPETLIEWQALGSSTAFVGLFDGSADLGASSRPINEAELGEAKARGRSFDEWVIAYDGIAILVHAGNPLPALTVDQASAIFQGRIRNFKEVGGPDRQIKRIARPSYSGTHAFFKEKVLRKGNSKGPEEFASDTEFVEHSSEIAARVAADPAAISFLGLGWVKPGTRAVPMAAGKGREAVAPSIATVRDGSYPVFRALYLYSPKPARPEVQNLIAFTLSPRGQQLVAENGFVSADVTTKLAYTPSRSAATTAAAPSAPATPGAASAPAPLAARPLAPAPVAAPAAPVRVFFDFGGVRLTDEASFKLSEIARRLAERPDLRALLVGHADAQGAVEANRRISAARANVVYQTLAGLGVAPGRLAIEAKGSDEPIGTNVTAEGRRQNRRVDVVLLEKGATAAR